MPTKVAAKKIATPKLDALQATVPDSELLTVQVGDRELKVKQLLDWPADSLDDLQSANYRPWFEAAVVDGEKLWAERTPTVREILQLIQALDVEKLMAGLSLGEIVSLAVFVEAHFEAVTWDLRRYCGARLRDLYTGGLLWVELDAYLQKLPMESATWTEQRDSLTADELAEMAAAGDETRFGPWSKTDFLIAEVYDAIERLRYIQTVSKSAKHANVPMPEPRKRPGVGGRAKPRLNPAAVSYLTEIRERHRLEAQQ